MDIDLLSISIPGYLVAPVISLTFIVLVDLFATYASYISRGSANRLRWQSWLGPAVGAVVAIVALLAVLGGLLANMGVERADNWASIASFFLAVTVLVVQGVFRFGQNGPPGDEQNDPGDNER